MQFEDWQIFKERLKCQLNSELPGLQSHKRMMSAQHKNILNLKAGADAKQAAVLILLFPEGKEIKTVLIVRSAYNGMHSKQVAFPGGKIEESDIDLTATALREAKEEIGLDAQDIEIAGYLSPLYVFVSNFLVQPVIAYIDEIGELRPCEREVERILAVALREIFNNLDECEVGSAMDETLRWQSPAFVLQNATVIWGATAMILAELEDVLLRIYS